MGNAIAQSDPAFHAAFADIMEEPRDLRIRRCLPALEFFIYTQ